MTYPAQPGNRGEPSGPIRPATINTAFWFGIASSVVGFLLLGVSFASIAEADAEHQVITGASVRAGALTLEQARAVVHATMLALVLCFVVIAALWVMFLHYMRTGRNWARVVVTLIAAAWVVFTTPSVLSGSGGAVGILLTTLQLLTILGTVVFAYRRSSQDYFDALREFSRNVGSPG